MSFMVKTVFESDTLLMNYREKTEEIRLDVCMSACVKPASACVRWNSKLAKKFLCVNELILIHSTTGFYTTS
jgi:hypothetical protein